MATRTWDKDRAAKRIDAAIAGLPIRDIEIKDYVRDTSLTDLPRHVAYRVDGVHMYTEILNVQEMLHVTDVEGEICHRRTLRFLNLHYRAVHRILGGVDAIRVDFHNERLHAVIVKPYDAESNRVHRAVATGQLMIDVLARTGEDADHPAAEVRIGIDTGKALAVNNGRRGHREPLFLGEPANHAAKRACGGEATGIYLTNHARFAAGFAKVANEDLTPMTADEIRKSQGKADLGVTADKIVKEWQDDLDRNPIGAFGFSGHTPPFATLDIETLTVRDSRRQDAATMYADLDGFTAYVTQNIAHDESARHVVRTLHVLRGELDAALHADFAGRKVRFIGDCVQGILVEGTAQTTDAYETISNTTLCVAAMRSSFNLALQKLRAAGTDATGLELAIGFEYGPMTITRLGMKSDLVRCSVSRGVLAAEAEQCNCEGRETAIGAEAYNAAGDAVRALFGVNRRRADLDYDTAVEELAKRDDPAAKRARALRPSSLLRPVTVAPAAASAFSFPEQRTGPAKPAGFA